MAGIWTVSSMATKLSSNKETSLRILPYLIKQKVVFKILGSHQCPLFLSLGEKVSWTIFSRTSSGPRCPLSYFSLPNHRSISAISFGSESITKQRFGGLFLLIFLLFFPRTHQVLLLITGNFHLLIFPYSLSLLAFSRNTDPSIHLETAHSKSEVWDERSI